MNRTQRFVSVFTSTSRREIWNKPSEISCFCSLCLQSCDSWMSLSVTMSLHKSQDRLGLLSTSSVDHPRPSLSSFWPKMTQCSGMEARDLLKMIILRAIHSQNISKVSGHIKLLVIIASYFVTSCGGGKTRNYTNIVDLFAGSVTDIFFARI